jgi:hypothetical protein
MLPVLYNNLKRIVQTPDYIVIVVEMNNDARIVRMNAEHDPDDMRRWLGDSIGYWDGDVLVVDFSGLVVVGLTTYGNQLIAGGSFNSAGESSAANLAGWDGNDWQEFGGGMNDWVQALTVFNGDLIATGGFTEAGGIPANYIARWNADEGWQPLGSGIAAQGQVITRAVIEYDGELIVGGFFNTAGGIPVNNIARWDGQSFHGLGDCPAAASQGCGVNSLVVTLALYDGDLVAGGDFWIDGTSTSADRVAQQRTRGAVTPPSAGWGRNLAREGL